MIKVIPGKYLPSNTVIVSLDIYERIKKEIPIAERDAWQQLFDLTEVPAGRVPIKVELPDD